MATRVRRRRVPNTQVFTSGPWNNVQTTTDPFDDDPPQLIDATNIYIPDPTGKSGAYQLPGMTLDNSGNPVVTALSGDLLTTEGGVTLTTEQAISFASLAVESLLSNTRLRGQGVFSHTDLDGTVTNFAVVNGRLYRANAPRTIYTDVTPVYPIMIDSGVTTRVYGTSFANQLVITDGVNTPWLATNLQSTPITGTRIDFDGTGAAWSAFGPFVLYAGSFFCIVNVQGGVSARSDIAWTIPADASQGYQQSLYDFRWTLEQSNTSGSFAISGLAATNTQLYYFREHSIGSISGTPGPNLQGQATHDAISTNIGTTSPQSIQQFGTNIFFTDAIGRPYRLVEGSRTLDPIWLNLRAIVDAQATGVPTLTATVCTSVLEPSLNLYIVAPWTCSAGAQGPSIEGYTFDARTGSYFGRFQVSTGCQLETMGTFVDPNGNSVLIVLGSAIAPTTAGLAASGYLWSLNNQTGIGDYLITESAVSLTDESGLLFLTSEGNVANWLDNGAPKVVSITTGRMGYDLETVVSIDRVQALVGSSSPVTVSMLTASVTTTVEGVPTPSTTYDGIKKLVVGASGMQGRGITVTLSPTQTTEQWSVQQVSATGTVAYAGADEP